MLSPPECPLWRNVARLFEPLKPPAVHVIRSYDDQISGCQALAARSVEQLLPTFRPLAAPRGLTEELVARITADITGGHLPPGSKLPTEKEMMAATGVSRTVVREAVACLRADGLVMVRQGVGAFVAEHVRRPFRIDVDELDSLREALDVMELRAGVEIEAAGLAAERHNGADIKKIAEAFRRIEDAIGRGETAVDEDFSFHCSIADATGNAQFRRFLDYLGRFIIPRQSIRKSLTRIEDQRAYLKRIQNEHMEILDAIRAGAAATARAAMRRHLVDSRKRYQKLVAEIGDGAAARPHHRKFYQPRGAMQTVLVTGAAGGIGTRLRKLLDGVYPHLRWSDIRKPADLASDQTFVQADLADLAQVEKLVDGVDGIVHLGGNSVEQSWDRILKANIIGCYNLFEAARRQKVKRVVFASSNHAVGFYPRQRKIGTDEPVRPDSRYGVSKAFGEAIGALYAYKHGLRVTCIRIGNFADAPVDLRRLAIWISPEDLVQLIRIGLEHPDLRYEIFFGASDNERSWWDNEAAYRLRLSPDRPRRRFRRRGAGRAKEACGRSDRRLVPGRPVLQRRIRQRF